MSDAKTLIVDERWILCDAGPIRLLGCLVFPEGEDATKASHAAQPDMLISLDPCYELVTMSDGNGNAGVQVIPYAMLGIGCPVDVIPTTVSRYGEMHPLDRDVVRGWVTVGEATKQALRAARAPAKGAT